MFCELLDIPDTFQSYYVVHTLTPGVSGGRFKIESEHQGSLLGWLSPFGAINGDPFFGISVDYQACLSPPIMVLELLYYSFGMTDPCGEMRVVAHPTSNPPGLWAMDCNQTLVPAQGFTSYITNIFGLCPCTSPVPVEGKTWGQVKAMYR